MTFLSLTAELLGKIDFERSKIIQPGKLVFVCGGQWGKRADAPASLRELLLARVELNGTPNVIGDAKVILAEDAVNALAKSSFKNLLDLEEYLASVAQAVILIVESPGSMCELGAFIKTKEISEKLIAVLRGEHKNKSSFITKGAIDYLNEHHPQAEVLGFHWNVIDGIVSAEDYMIDGMLRDIPDAMARLGRTHVRERFDRSKRGHLIFLTLAFCHYLRAAKLSDIKFCFKAIAIDVSDGSIKSFIDILQICKYIKEVEQGRLMFYVARVERAPLDPTFRKDTPDRSRDGMRMVSLIRNAIEEADPIRLQMFRDHHNG